MCNLTVYLLYSPISCFIWFHPEFALTGTICLAQVTLKKHYCICKMVLTVLVRACKLSIETKTPFPPHIYIQIQNKQEPEHSWMSKNNFSSFSCVVCKDQDHCMADALLTALSRVSEGPFSPNNSQCEAQWRSKGCWIHTNRFSMAQPLCTGPASPRPGWLHPYPTALGSAPSMLPRYPGITTHRSGCVKFWFFFLAHNPWWSPLTGKGSSVGVGWLGVMGIQG